MKENWRLVRQWTGIGEAGCLYDYRLEDIYQGKTPNSHPFVKHYPDPLQTRDVEQLRVRLNAMLAALDDPLLEWTPRQLVEVKKERQSVTNTSNEVWYHPDWSLHGARRYDALDYSEISCRCGAMFKWGGSSDDLEPWIALHLPHMNEETK